MQRRTQDGLSKMAYLTQDEIGQIHQLQEKAMRDTRKAYPIRRTRRATLLAK
ncbi:MAG: hypothetical protein HOZ81_18705 [Streptomyces sp.]|nr:hypothetical protein [Streptomyces sp.]